MGETGQLTIPSRETLSTLYNQGKSLPEVAKILICSPHKVVYWMRKYNIPRRSRSEALYVKLTPHGDPFKIKTDLSPEEKYLLGLGIGIYWGEGNKAHKNSLRVANSDPELLIVFRKFLLRICQFPKERIGYSIVCFNDSDPAEVLEFWSTKLQILPEKFGKIVQIPTQGKGTYKRKSLHGVCTLTVGNLKLKNWIMEKLSS